MPRPVRIPVITPNGEGLKEALVGNVPSPLTYTNPNMPRAVQEEDLAIQSYLLQVRPENVRVNPADEFFKKPGIPRG